MRIVSGFALFWWDFIVGDDWRIAVGVGLVLACGALLVAGTGASDPLVATLTAVGMIAMAVAIIVASAR